MLARQLNSNRKPNATDSLVSGIWSIIMKHGNSIPNAPEQNMDGRLINLRRIETAIASNRPIEFILPAFPAKSPNPEKTLGSMPDLGEVLGLKRLQKIADSIKELYEPGALIHICSDGRVFSDLVQVSDLQVSIYRDAINEIIAEFNLSSLRTFNLEDIRSDISFTEMREQLVRNYARSVSEIRSDVREKMEDKLMFNGIHRFMYEDYAALQSGLSKNQLKKQTKEIAYQVIQRSNAWSRFVEEVFPEAVRLSIHPQFANNRKIGVQLVKCQNQWGTPWHNVVLQDESGLRLVKRREAELMGAELRLAHGKYAYFTLEGAHR